MTDYFVQILTAFIGTFGFSLVFKSRKALILINSLGGALVWICYLISFTATENLFVSYMLAAVATGIYSEIMARSYKTPATTILVPVSVVLIPGSSLFYTMQALFKNDFIKFTEKGSETLKIATAIALGIIIVSTFMKIINSIFMKIKNNRKHT